MRLSDRLGVPSNSYAKFRGMVPEIDWFFTAISLMMGL